MFSLHSDRGECEIDFAKTVSAKCSFLFGFWIFKSLPVEPLDLMVLILDSTEFNEELSKSWITMMTLKVMVECVIDSYKVLADIQQHRTHTLRLRPIRRMRNRPTSCLSLIHI